VFPGYGRGQSLWQTIPFFYGTITMSEHDSASSLAQRRTGRQRGDCRIEDYEIHRAQRVHKNVHP
jgi:hypothetical protein